MASVVTGSERFIELLRRTGQLEWAGAGTDPLAGGLALPPVAVFRFVDETADLPTLVLDAVRRHSGPVDWSFEKSGRNWVLWPAVCARLADTNPTEPSAWVRSTIGERDEPGVAAMLLDFESIMDEVEAAIGPVRESA